MYLQLVTQLSLLVCAVRGFPRPQLSDPEGQQISPRSFQTAGGLSGASGGFGQAGQSLAFSNSIGSSGISNVEKNLYTFVAPDMPAGPPIVIGGPQGIFKKRYNVIFVKTPSMPAPEIILPQFSGGLQEKNLIYVVQEIPRRPIVPNIEFSEQAAPLKPEVFLIKYENGEELGAAGITQTLLGQQQGSFGQGALGVSSLGSFGSAGSSVTIPGSDLSQVFQSVQSNGLRRVSIQGDELTGTNVDQDAIIENSIGEDTVSLVPGISQLVRHHSDDDEGSSSESSDEKSEEKQIR